MSTSSHTPVGEPNASSPAAGSGAVNPAPQGYAGSPYGVPAPVAMPKLPGRGGAVTTIILGIVLMIIVAPLVVLAMVISGATGAPGQSVEGGTKENGDIVTVTADGHYMVGGTGGKEPECSLIGRDDEVYKLEPYDGHDDAYLASDVPAGEYKLDCDGISASESITGYNTTPEVMTKVVFAPLLWGSGVGVAGLVVLIVGIVLLVKVNGKRRRMTQEAMMSAVR